MLGERNTDGSENDEDREKNANGYGIREFHTSDNLYSVGLKVNAVSPEWDYSDKVTPETF